MQHLNTENADKDSEIDSRITTVSRQGSMKKSSIGGIPSAKTLKDNRTSMSTNGELEHARLKALDPDEILNHTCSSSFGQHRTDKDFTKK